MLNSLSLSLSLSLFFFFFSLSLSLSLPLSPGIKSGRHERAAGRRNDAAAERLTGTLPRRQALAEGSWAASPSPSLQREPRLLLTALLSPSVHCVGEHSL
jgi:hypothetical protein